MELAKDLPKGITFIENPYRINSVWKIGYVEKEVYDRGATYTERRNVLYSLPIFDRQDRNVQESLEMRYRHSFLELEGRDREIFKKRCVGYSQKFRKLESITMGDMDELYERLEGDWLDE